MLGRSDYMCDYEPCLYGWVGRPASPRRSRPPADATAVWEIASTIEDGERPSPHDQAGRAASAGRSTYHTLPGEVIYEPFAGSGTALIAAESGPALLCARALARPSATSS